MNIMLRFAAIVICLILLFAYTSGIPAAKPADPGKFDPAYPLFNSNPQAPAMGKYKMHFGINGGMYPDINAGAAAIRAVTAELDKLGMVWLRHPGKGTTWFEVQPIKGTWDFRKLDAVINNNGHPWVLELYGANGTVYPFGQKRPLTEILRTLAAAGGSQAVYQFIRDHSVDMNDEVQRADAEKYIKIFVKRYKDKIRYWEIGNEGIVAPGTFDIIKNTYTWIKEAFPGAVVLVTAVAGDDDPMFEKHLQALDSLLARGLGRYFDVANIHYYGRVTDDFQQKLEKAYDDYKTTLNKHGINKPVWITETSASSHVDSVLSGPSSEQEQARQVVKRLVIFSAKGAEKVFWHDYRETYSDNKFFQCNLVDFKTNVPKPAWHSFKLTVDKLGYYQSIRTLRSGPVRVYRFTNPDNHHVYVAWADSPRTLNLTEFIESEYVLLTRIVEKPNTKPQTVAGKTADIRLSASPVFIEPSDK